MFPAARALRRTAPPHRRPPPADRPAPGPIGPELPGPALAGPPIGREGVLAELAAGLGVGRHRLATLVGPGGVGKTTVALTASGRLADEYAGGVVFVDLAPLGSAELMLAGVGRAFGLPESSGNDPTAGTIAALSGRHALLVLDNLEHLLPAAPAIAELLASCPDLVVLATSRAPLRLRGEWVVAVPPLPVPIADDVETIVSSPAARLFLDRAGLAGGSVRLDTDAAAVAEICRRLDGLPLALELAAAQTRTLPPRDLLDRLDRLATAAGPRDLPARHRTLDATLDWSFELLAPREQESFAQLSVFGGSFGLAAAEAVLGDMSDPVAALEVLIDQALVTRVTGSGGRARFRLLQPVREYAARRLTSYGPQLAGPTRNRHARFFAQLADDLRPALHDDRLLAALDQVELEHPELRLAVERLRATGHVDDAAGMVWSLWLGLALRGHAREALEWLAALPDPELTMSGAARASVARAGLRLVGGDIARMGVDAARASEAAAGLDGEPELRAEIDLVAGLAAVFDDRAEEAGRLLSGLAARTGPSFLAWHHAHAVAGLAQCELVIRSGDRSLPFDDPGDPRSHAAIDRARRGLVEAESEARTLGNPFTLATVLNVRGTLEKLAGDDQATADAVLEAVRLGLRARMGWTLAYSLAAVAAVAADAGEPVIAGQLFGAVAALSASHAVDPRFAASQALASRAEDQVRRQLSPHALETAWADGRAASFDRIAELVDELGAGISSGRSGQPRTRAT